MNLKTIQKYTFASMLLFGGCIFIPPDKSKQPPLGSYAEVRINSSNEMQLLICADLSNRIYASPDGFKHEGGQATYFGAVLKGDGPVFVDPPMVYNQGPQYTFHGTVVLDLLNKLVTINITRSTKQAEGLPKVEAHLANGTYPIKLISHEPFVESLWYHGM